MLLAAVVTALLVGPGCQSLQAQAGPQQPPEPTATIEPRSPAPTPSPTPSATALPAATPTTPPTMPPTPSPNVAAPPTPETDEALARLRDFLSQRRREGASVEDIAKDLASAPLPADTTANALPVSARDEGELPIILVVYGSQPVRWGYAIFWWEGDQLRYQSFPSGDSRRKPGAEDLGPNSDFIAARQQVRDGKIELGIVYDATYGGSAESHVFRLLRLEQGTWRTLWDGLNDGERRWKTSHANVAFGNSPSGTSDPLATIVLRSSSWNDPDGKGGFFHESNPGPHRYFNDTWERRDDRYELTQSRVEPSAYATLVEFVYRLSQGQDVEAAKLVTRPDLIERAKALGLNQKPATPWLIDLSSPEIEMSGPIAIVEGPPATIQFEERSGEWLINEISSP